jgi:hypothetical protein
MKPQTTKKLIRGTMMLGTIGLVSSSLMGCALLHRSQPKVVELVQVTKTQHAPQPKPAPYLTTTNSVNLGSMPVAYHPSQPLPAVFDISVSYSLAQYDNLISLKALMAQKDQMVLNVKAPALKHIEDYFAQGGTVAYQGSFKGLLSQISKDAGVFWKYDATQNTVTYYLYQYSTINVPKDKLAGVIRIIKGDGYLLRKSDNSYQVFSTSNRLKQVYQYLSND